MSESHSVGSKPDRLFAMTSREVQKTIVDRIRRLSPLELEGLLRPAFRQAEWKLIAVGAVIGELEVLALLG